MGTGRGQARAVVEAGAEAKIGGGVAVEAGVENVVAGAENGDEREAEVEDASVGVGAGIVNDAGGEVVVPLARSHGHH